MNKKYTEALKSLYGNEIFKKTSLNASLSRSSRYEKKKGVLSEAEEQVRVVTWLTKKNVPFYHVPNGGRRDYKEACKLKSLGVRAGVPDICIVLARKGFHGLYIELKRAEGGKLSDAQIWWRDLLLREGYAWHEAKGAQECIKIIEGYMNG